MRLHRSPGAESGVGAARASRRSRRFMKAAGLPGALLLVGLVAVQTAGLASGSGVESKVQGHRDQAALDLHRRWTFDAGKPGESPMGFSMLTVGAGSAGKWAIEYDLQAPSAPNRLTQSPSCADADAAGCLQVLLAEGMAYEYADLSVRLRMISEKTHGGGGIAFKARDLLNFYAAIVDLADDKLEVIRLVDGRLTVLGRASVTRKPVDWHTLRVQHNTILSKDFLEDLVRRPDRIFQMGERGRRRADRAGHHRRGNRRVRQFRRDPTLLAASPLTTGRVLRARETCDRIEVVSPEPSSLQHDYASVTDGARLAAYCRAKTTTWSLPRRLAW